MFNAHKSRKHGGYSDFGECVVLADNDTAPVVVAAESLGEPAERHSAGSADTFDLNEVNSQCDTLRAQLNHNLASLFLKMQSILHVSVMASQEIVEHLIQIFFLSQPILKHDIREVLQSHDITVSETLLNEVVSTGQLWTVMSLSVPQLRRSSYPQPRKRKPSSKIITLW